MNENQPSLGTVLAQGAGTVPHWLRHLRRDVRRNLAAAAALQAAAAVALTAWARLPAWVALLAPGLLALGAAWVWRGLAAHPHARFGPANRVTLGRLAMTALFAAVAVALLRGEPAEPALLAWSLVVLATITAVVDATDGPLARRSGLASTFGARFDMETDALFMLVLCMLIVLLGKTGPWVFASGLMRYAFIAATRLRPLAWLGRPLPPSTRRQAVCVLQIVALIFCLGPVITPPWCAAIAGAGLALLTWSFAVDVIWLARARRAP